MGALPFVIAGNDLTYVTHLPTLAATAWYHKKLPDPGQDLTALLTEVEQFACGEYLQALFQRRHALGGGEGADRREAAPLHGRVQAVHPRSDLRLYAPRFAKELLRDEGKATGFLDSALRAEGARQRSRRSPTATRSTPRRGRSTSRSSRATCAMTSASTSRSATCPRTARPTAAGSGRERARRLRRLRRRHRRAGAGDQGQRGAARVRRRRLQRPGDVLLRQKPTCSHHSGIDPARLTIRNYPAGHMMYLHRPSLEALSNDIVKFIEAR